MLNKLIDHILELFGIETLKKEGDFTIFKFKLPHNEIVTLPLEDSYFHIAEKIKKDIPQINKSDIGMYNFTISEIYDLISRYTKDELQSDIYKAKAILNEIIGLAAQGRYNELNFFFTADSEDALNEIKTPELRFFFNYFITSNKDDLIFMCKTAKKTENSKAQIELGESVGEWINRLLSKNEKFMAVYNKLNQKDLIKDYLSR
jgi:hypothetical protein